MKIWFLLAINKFVIIKFAINKFVYQEVRWIQSINFHQVHLLILARLAGFLASGGRNLDSWTPRALS